jgi:hypothetical protein
MKMLAEYFEKALNFERMAAEEKDANLKANLDRLATAYRKLALGRAKELNVPLPPPQSK